MDFVRGLLKPLERAAMEGRLSGGCQECQQSLDLLRRFASLAQAEAQYDVPEYAVRAAKAVFALQQPERVHMLPRMAARMVFDSFREPLPAGMRAGHRISRQVLFEAGDYALDLRLEHERGSSYVTLVGQIANRKDPSLRMPDLPVFLLSARQIVARAFSNPFGEFQMEYKPKGRLRLFVPVEDWAKRIEVTLSGLLTASARNGNSREAGPAPRRRRRQEQEPESGLN